MYDNAMNSIREELEEFQNFENTSSEVVPHTDIRMKYRRLKMKEIVLISSSEDLAPLLKRSGLTKEEREYQRK